MSAGGFGSDISSDCPDVVGFLALAAGGQVELDVLALLERLVAAALDFGVVDEYIVALLTRDEAEAPLRVEEFHSSCCQRFLFSLLRTVSLTPSSQQS
jgi:hypothetical protein